MNKWLETLITFVYPAKCQCCKVPMAVDRVHYICDECWEKIEPLVPPWCEICGMPVHFVKANSVNHAYICVDCRAQLPLYDKLRSIAFYEPTLREAIHLFKYDRKQIFAKHLIRFMCEHFPADLSTEDYDLLLPIPLHHKRYRQRGFNQAEQIAQGIARIWKVPIDTEVLRRIRDTVPQSSLNSRQERVENITGAFEISSPEFIRDRKILLIDDIFTTGTTVNEALRVLNTAEAIGIDVLTLARARPSALKTSKLDMSRL